MTEDELPTGQPLDDNQLLIPNDETLKKYKDGETTFKICGWCKYAGSGRVYGKRDIGQCLAEGRCGLIPLAINDKGLMPPVKIEGGTIQQYNELQKKEKKALEIHEGHKTILVDMLKTVDRCGDEVIEDIEVVQWNTECLFVRSLANNDFKNDILRRLDSWIDEFKERITDRKRYIRELGDNDNKSG